MNLAFHGPRSKANAKALLEAAKSLGHVPQVVRTTRSGYLAPQDVVDVVLGVENIKEGVEYPPPPESVPEAQTEPERPRGNASREAWAEYVSKRLGVEITDDLSRDDIKNMVEE